eukprot:172677-Lingulodinium_polyedra.AAC.1
MLLFGRSQERILEASGQSEAVYAALATTTASQARQEQGHGEGERVAAEGVENCPICECRLANGRDQTYAWP